MLQQLWLTAKAARIKGFLPRVPMGTGDAPRVLGDHSAADNTENQIWRPPLPLVDSGNYGWVLDSILLHVAM